MSVSRRRERDQVTAVARRRMALLEAELAGLRASSTAEVADQAQPSDDRWEDAAPAAVTPMPSRGPGRDAVESREPGQHRQHAPSSRPPLRAGRPGMLDNPRDHAGRVAFGEPEPAYAFETAPLRAVPPAGELLLDPALDPALDPGPPPRDGPGAWLLDRLPETLQGRTALSGRAVVGLVLLAVLAVGLVGWTTLRSGGGEKVPQARVRTVAGASPTAAASTAAAGLTGTAPSAGAPATAASAQAAGGDVVVDVAGKVRRPGIVTLPAGSRVNDAIEGAGGARPGVSLTSLNLARVLVDGEQILVGVKGAVAAPAPVAGGTGGSGSSGSAGAAGGGALVNLNTADATALDTLPGVGEVTAQKILDYRTSHGGFTSIDQLLDVDGIGDKTLADIKPHVTV